MADISRPDYTYRWSSGGSLVSPSDVKIQTGWTAEVPPFQWENWSQNRQDNAIVHLFQKGISLWASTQDYYFVTNGPRSYVQGSDGNIYVSVQNSTGQDPTTDISDTYWKLAFTKASEFTGTNQSLGATGYQKFPGGLIHQWGIIPAIPANSSVLVTYAIPFPNTSFIILPGSGASGPGIPGVNGFAVSTTQARFWNSSTTVATQVGTYLVIGN